MDVFPRGTIGALSLHVTNVSGVERTHTWDQSKDLAWLTAKTYIKSVKSGWMVTSIKSVRSLYLIWQTNVYFAREEAV
jgi:hypothetical protein